MLQWFSHCGVAVAAGGSPLSAWQGEERARREAKAAVEFLGDAWKPTRARGGREGGPERRESAALLAVRESRGVVLRWKKMDCFAISEIFRDPNVNKQ